MRIQNMSILKSVAINQIVSCLENEVRDLEKENQMKKILFPCIICKKKVYSQCVFWLDAETNLFSLWFSDIDLQMCSVESRVLTRVSN